MSRPRASLSLDLDNLWSYLRTHGDPGWETFPSFLDLVVPRFLEVLADLGLTVTVFVVGKDAALTRNRAALRLVPEAGHEVGNHSEMHEPWLHRRTPEEIDAEIALAEEHVADATGVRPEGFRGPGYSLSRTILEVLHDRGYRYDASTFPTFLGPLGRAYYFTKARLSAEEAEERKDLFGSWRDGLRPARAYRWRLERGTLLEIPVTTLPGLKIPFHLSYPLYLSTYSPALARTYFATALRICRARGVEPSVLLHPLDFLGPEDGPELAFFPGMGIPLPEKLQRVRRHLEDLRTMFEVLPLGAHARALEGNGRLETRETVFAHGT